MQQFRPMMLRSPACQLSQECKWFEKDSEGGVVQVVIKRVMIPCGSSPKLVDLWCELKLAHLLHHVNILHMEQVYVDVIKEGLWISMELMGRSLVDVVTLR
jgi:hypothetical protein